MYRSFGVLVLVLGFGSFAGAGCGDDDDPSADCAKACATAATLKCANETEAMCNTECKQLFTIAPKCKTQFKALTSCTAARPATDFECDADGASELKSGVCEAEGTAALACLFAGS
jgi:hypothetical protein